jgi:hypothetical protein
MTPKPIKISLLLISVVWFATFIGWLAILNNIFNVFIAYTYAFSGGLFSIGSLALQLSKLVGLATLLLSMSSFHEMQYAMLNMATIYHLIFIAIAVVAIKKHRNSGRLFITTLAICLFFPFNFALSTLVMAGAVYLLYSSSARSWFASNPASASESIKWLDTVLLLKAIFILFNISLPYLLMIDLSNSINLQRIFFALVSQIVAISYSIFLIKQIQAVWKS